MNVLVLLLLNSRAYIKWVLFVYEQNASNLMVLQIAY